jgi:transposase
MHFTRYVGMDIHKKTMTWVALDAEKKLVGDGKLPMSALPGWAKKNLTKTDRVVIEATGNSHYVHKILSEYAGEVLMADPLAMHDRTRGRRKTDRVDAHALAEALVCDYVKAVWVPDDETWQKREYASHRRALAEQLTATRNQLRAILFRNGLEYAGRDIMDHASLKYACESCMPELTKGLYHSLWRVGQSLLEEIHKVDVDIAAKGLKDEECIRLMTLPGVGAHAALIIQSAVGDIHRFETPKNLASYSGLVPRVKKSDESVYYGAITKQGRSLLRWIMTEAANAGVMTPGPLRDRYQRLMRKGKKHQEAVVAVARYMLELIWHLMKKKTVFRHARAAYLQTKLRGVLRKAYGRSPKNAAATMANTLMGWKDSPATIT